MAVTKRRLLLHVQHPDGTTTQLIGRAAFLTAFIVAYAERINATDYGELTFDWATHNLRPNLRETFRSLMTLESSSSAAA